MVDLSVLIRLARIIDSRKSADPASSYVAQLLAKGNDAILKKIGEEAAETLLAGKEGDKLHIVRETADLWFHTLVMLSFHGLGPEDVVAECQQKGYKNMIMAGGPHLTTSFFQKKLIDELWLTIEPKIFGTGGNLVIEEKLDIDLRLLNIEKVNGKGTLITKYAVLH